MKKSKFTAPQIIFAIKQSETGTRVDEICRQLGISQATFFNWKKKCQLRFWFLKIRNRKIR